MHIERESEAYPKAITSRGNRKYQAIYYPSIKPFIKQLCKQAHQGILNNGNQYMLLTYLIRHLLSLITPVLLNYHYVYIVLYCTLSTNLIICMLYCPFCNNLILYMNLIMSMSHCNSNCTTCIFMYEIYYACHSVFYYCNTV